jgi:CheY-like chemotaxis protein
MTEGIKRVLLVDDNREVLNLYQIALERFGAFSVTMASSALDALELLSENPDYDLIITDIMMAWMDGWELLAAVMGLAGVGAPVIIITAFDEIGTETKAWRRGAAAVYFKGRSPLSKLVNLAKVHTGQIRSKFHDS